MTRGTFRVEFTSDWHVGTGAGRSGDVDRLIAREWVRVGDNGTPFQVPVLPAKTLTGILRDAAERLAFGLDNGTDQGPWSGYVRWMFGDTRGPASLRIRPGDLSEALISALDRDPWARLGLTTVRASTAIDPATGTAAEHTLRTIEVGRAGTVFDAVWELVDDGAPTVTVDGEDRHVDPVRFLATVAALVDGIGAKRRRGLGRCTIEVWYRSGTAGSDEADGQAQVASTIDELTCPPPSGSSIDATHSLDAAAPTEPAGSRDPGQGPDRVSLVRVPLVIEAKTDLLVGATRFGNVVESSDFIPGRLLFPIVCNALRRAGVDPGALIASDRIRVGDANPAPAGVRLEPVPFALSRHKEPTVSTGAADGTDGTAERTATPVVNTLAPERSEVQSKQLRDGYVDANSKPDPQGELGVVLAVRVATTHNSIEDETQRPDESTGGVYTYESLAAGQWFEGFVDLPRDAAGAVAEHLLGVEHRVGVSAKDDYGLVYVEGLDTEGGSPGDSALADPGTTPTAPESETPGELTVWCVSDVVLRDDSLAFAPTPEALGAAVSAALGLPGTWVPDPDRVRVRTRRIDGFHTGWGLPQTTLLAVARGSCVTLTLQPDQSGLAAPHQPTPPAECWVGERTAEGYGRVLVNPPLLASGQSPLFQNVRTTAATVGRFVKVTEFPTSSAEHNDAGPDAYQQLLRTARLDALRVEILRRIAGLDLDRAKLAIPGREPTSSAVGTLRRRLLESDDPGNHPAVTWFQSATRAFPEAKPWTGPMNQVLTEKKAIWELLWNDAAPLSEDEQRELWVFAVRGLVEHVERVRGPQQRPDAGGRGDGNRRGNGQGNRRRNRRGTRPRRED